jgi:hypothetical protein
MLLATLALAVAVPAVALVAAAALGAGSSTSSDSPVNRQAFAELHKSVATISKSFATLKPLTISVCNKGAVGETVSGTFSGGAVDLRVRARSGAPRVPTVLIPGVAHIHTGGKTTSFSYTFALQSTGELLRSFQVQWRSPNGGHSVVKNALARVLYKRPQHLCA